MTNRHSKIVVIPEEGEHSFLQDDEKALEFAADLIGAEKPEDAGFVDLLKDSVMRAHPIVGLSVKAGKTAIDAVTDLPEDPTKRWDRIVKNESLATALVRSFFRYQVSSQERINDISVFERGDSTVEKFSSPSGYFRTDVVYRQHPARDNYFVPLAEFHPNMLRDKQAEFLRIATALGAKDVRLASFDESSRNADAEAGVKDPTNNVNVGAKGGGHSNKRRTFDLSVTSDIPVEPPEEPDETYWLRREPMWQAMVDARLKQWTTSFRVNFSYKSDFGVNADLAATVKGLGFGIGGEYQSKSTMEREYVVDFWSKSAYE